MGEYDNHQTRLGIEMRSVADRAALPESRPLRTAAAEFDRVTQGHFDDPMTVTVSDFMHAWKKAKDELGGYRRWVR